MAQKRTLEDATSTHKPKKPKTTEHVAPTAAASNLTADEVDFPRGGGTSFTPLEVKAIRAEAVKEANDELFTESEPASKKAKKSKRKSEAGTAKSSTEKSDRVARIEHLNYKRMSVGMKIFGQIVSIQPLALVVSLPNQLFGHVPITNISSQFTSLLESMDVDEDDEDEENLEDEQAESRSKVPELSDMFHPGQYVRATVTTIYVPGTTDVTGLGKSRDETAKASRRIELSLSPEKVNAEMQKSDLKAGYTLSVSVKSVEDHGYLLDLGIPDVSGFLSKLRVGQLLDATVSSISKNGRTCNVTLDPETFSSSTLTEIGNVSSVLPGTLVQTLITAVHPTGFNLQVLGFFDGTVDEFHLPRKMTEKSHKVGKKVKARVLYYLPSTPPKLALSLNEHVVGLTNCKAYPIGTLVNDVKERGLTVRLDSEIDGFVHISHISDDHTPSLSNSGLWKLGSLHRARVLGYYPFDGLLQLSLKPSILEQKYLQVADVQVGEIVKGTIKKLGDSGLFVSLSGNVDGVVWPNHYADIVLKNPSKRFKVGATIKCRVLVVDPEKNRVFLTAKKSLIDSDLPRITSFEAAKVGLVTHGVVFKVLPKALMIEFYNNVKAIIPIKEVSEESIDNLSSLYSAGKVVKVRIVTLKTEENTIIASIRKSGGVYKTFNTDISGVDIGNILEGVVAEIHKENIILSLQPSNVRALISINNLANHRGLSPAQLKVVLKTDDKLEDLVVVSRNTEDNFVIVANKPKPKPTLVKTTISMDTVEIGQTVGGRVVRHTAHGALVKLPSNIGGILHPTDVSDDFGSASAFPAVDSILKAAVVSVDKDRKQLTLSTRRSRMYPDQAGTVVDREISEISDLHVGATVRGFIKSITDHGLFLQIRELFDDFIKDWKPNFELHQLVQRPADANAKKVEMTLRSGDLSKPVALTLSSLSVGQHLEGSVKRIEEYGLFIQIDKFKIKWSLSQLSDNKEADTAIALRGFRENDRVKAVVVGIKDKRLSLSLKPSHFSEEDFTPENDGDEHEAGDQSMEALDGVDSESNGEASDEESDDEEVAMQVDVDQTSSTKKPSNGPLKLSSGFQWFGNTVNVDAESSSDSEDSDNEAPSKKKKKKQRKEIEQDLTAQMHTKAPESNADFERLLLGSPNSSYLWIQYMSFQLQLSEIEKAREIGRQKRQEKLNVWIALLNLENAYGTEETLEKVFKDAARANDSKTVHLRLASILDQSGKHKKAEEQYKRTGKKFGLSSKVWTLFAEHYLQRGEIEESRKLLSRALQSLEKRKHLKTISRFAQLEYKLGEPERGKTLFEGIIDSHPKRWDMWSVYMDMEAGQSDIQSLRSLFDRVLQLKLTSHKAKSFFKKWLELERRLGDEEGAEMVKQKAVEWTQKSNTLS
ncbi:U3 snoRNP-associated protein Rrp5 [Gymnopus androsaceus JB14]|uniref:U3 snoRNP-associated protein Rrp5 n=1 Tax=Gymnopus androsaceus JB14 TaxID=1447944 RepID=A0A6A4ICK1_9AGAR|nr:U3 snoRNP-associated protein Rrp5 [Gymnopus androsaceus JB14]